MGTQKVKTASVTFSEGRVGEITSALKANDISTATTEMANTFYSSRHALTQLSDLYAVSTKAIEVLNGGISANGGQTVGGFISEYASDMAAKKVTSDSIELFVEKLIQEGNFAVDPASKELIIKTFSKFLGKYVVEGKSLSALPIDPSTFFIAVSFIAVFTLLEHLRKSQDVGLYSDLTNNGKIRTEDKEKFERQIEKFSKEISKEMVTNLDNKDLKSRKKTRNKIMNTFKEKAKEKNLNAKLNYQEPQEYQLNLIRYKGDENLRKGRRSKKKPKIFIHTPDSQVAPKPGELKIPESRGLGELGVLTQEEEDLINLIRVLYITEIVTSDMDSARVKFSTLLKEYWEDKVKDLESLYEYLTRKTVKIELIQSKSEPRSGNVEKKFYADEVCLLSGGIDSFAGAMKLLNEGKKILCVHVSSGQSTIKEVNNHLEGKYRSKYRLYKVSNKSPNGIGKRKQGSNTRQLRSLVFLSIALLFARRSGAKKIAIPESGTTMINIAINEAVEVTRTVQPDYLNHLKPFFNSLFDDYEVEDIYSPLEDMTKSNVVKELINSSAGEVASQTFSCFNARRGKKINCGQCYGCVTRRLSFITAGYDDIDNYEFDIFTEDINEINNNIERFYILLEIMNFSAEVVNWSDLGSNYKHEIEKSGKKELLTRFYKELLYAVYLRWRNNENSKSPIIQKFDRLVTKGKINTEVLGD